MKDKSISNVRLNIQRSIEQAEVERRGKLLNHRLELARSGVSAYQKKKMTEAVQAFQTYLKVLEELKNVAEGGLMPSIFDLKKELPELLVVSGVYWDLAKLYDRTQSAEKHKEFLHYLEKFIVFARGMPHQVLCAETLRKYIGSGKTLHTEDFKNAYRSITGSRCFVATSLIDLIEPTTLPRLRRYRDDVLLKRAWGRTFVRAYYQAGPVFAWILDRSPRWVRISVARALDAVSDL